MTTIATRTAAGVSVGLALAGALAGPVGASAEATGIDSASGGDRANIVVVMVDDMSIELLQHVPAATDLIAAGVTFENAIVSTALCCPSRATFLTGQYPHNTGVQTNGRRNGGFAHYRAERNRDLGYALQRSGYRTGYVGKYLTGYHPEGETGRRGYPRGLVPRGWDEWFVGGAYAGWHYTLTESVDGLPPAGSNVFTHDGETEADYFTDFASDRAVEFVARAGDQPFALVVTPFASHRRLVGSADPDPGYQPAVPPAPRDRHDSKTAPWPNEFAEGDCGGVPLGGCSAVIAPDEIWAESFNTVGTDAPSWRADLSAISDLEDRATVLTRERAQSLQAVSDLIVRLRGALGAEIDNTYLVFTSDNGFFLGQHRLFGGKGTAYDHDVRVPLVIVPPGGRAEPRSVTAVVQNVDLAPTLAEIAGAPLVLPPDGMSLLPWLGPPEALPTSWRDGGLISFLGGEDGLGPDRSQTGKIVPPYKALRTEQYLYVDYTEVDATPPNDHLDGEFFWLASDAEQLDNRYDDLAPEQRHDLNSALVAYSSCAKLACRQADLPEIMPPVE